MRVIFAVFLLATVSQASDWKQLFDGRTSTGGRWWPRSFRGRERNAQNRRRHGAALVHGANIGHSTIRVVFKTASPTPTQGLHSFPEPPKDPWYAVHNGYEVQIDAGGDEWHCTGSLYSLSKVTKRNQKPAGEWNTMDITIDGQKTTVKLNGEVVNTFVGNQPVPERHAWYEPVRGPRPDQATSACKTTTAHRRCTSRKSRKVRVTAICATVARDTMPVDDALRPGPFFDSLRLIGILLRSFRGGTALSDLPCNRG